MDELEGDQLKVENLELKDGCWPLAFGFQLYSEKLKVSRSGQPISKTDKRIITCWAKKYSHQLQ